MDYSLVIHGGTLILGSDVVVADIGVEGGTIAAIGQDLRGGISLDAHGKYVIPGAVDPHVHIEMPVGETRSSDTWETGTIAAAFGGTTSVVDFIEPNPGGRLLDAFAARCGLADSHAVIDFGLHMTLCDDKTETLAQVPAVVAAGMTSFKMYTTYDGFRLEDAQLLNLMSAVGRAGGMGIVHSENDAMIQWLRKKFLDEGKTTPRYHPLSRPAEAEGEAVERVLSLAHAAGAPTYIVHVSTARGAGAIERARERGQRAFGETCPQYLLLTDAAYERPDFQGAKFVCSPPLRHADDNAALWDALARGELQTVGTDHCPFNFRGQKELGQDDFTKIPGGLPGIEARLALLYTFGVRANRLSLSRWVQVCCTEPARLFGLYPRKGVLAPGADADICIFDPEKRVTLSKQVLHENVDYTPYEGMELVGYPTTVLSRGEILIQGDKFLGKEGRGQYLKRGAPVWPASP